ncbi:hypothetical protein LPW11_06985 [Geomonas sp. RF6]|uniref:FmdB family zinc ribbon protein n=1 Tax=Geomonas sp. RF6 TaxID=2897342 RepID=UPI001E2E1960|nr:FmdB family zinc ribbon protein [Geomonas sp. RF6]UFS71929.1 hypothetical protein LPW11_06985 [Geomonas sp. RF6]
MPTYEYRCETCSQTFVVQMSMSDHEKAEIICPSCQKATSIPQYSAFYARTSKKS